MHIHKIQDTAAFGFIFCVALLSVVSVLGVWEFFDRDVIGKSFTSVGLLAVVAIVIMVAGRFIDRQHALEVPPGSTVAVDVPVPTNPTFTTIRHMTLVVLIASAVFLGLIGILAIWEVLQGDAVYKSLATMAICGFASFVIVMTSLDRENHKWLRREDGKKSSMGLGTIIFLTLLGLWVLSTFFALL